MPPAQRRQPTGVVARLLAEPHRFAFFQAVRVLNRWFARRDGSAASAALSPRLHFRNTMSLSFPASEIAEFRLLHDDASESPADETRAPPMHGEGGDGDAVSDAKRPPDVAGVEMSPAFMSLLGAGGALPIFYTELLAERERYHRDTAARAFLDIFQQRAVTLFYESWRKHRLPVRYEDDQREQFLPLVLAVAGVGQHALRDRMHGDEGGVSDDTIAYFAGLLQQRPVSAGTVQQVVCQYFDVDAQVEQFIGRWFTLPPDSSTSLGLANARLGASAVVGERVWQRDLRMRMTIGPMNREKLRRFLPGGTAALALHELLTLMTGVTLEYEVRLALSADEVQGTALESGRGGGQLGWDSFLVTRPALHDRDDAGYDIHALH